MPVIFYAMRNWFVFIFVFMQVLQAQVLTGPLEVNPTLWHQRPQGITFSSGTELIFPSGSSSFYKLDTLTLPIVDDFSSDRRMSFQTWDYPQQVDSVRVRYRVIPAPPQWPFAFSADTTYIYQVNGSAVDSTVSPSFQVIYYTHPDNPFVPFDTQTVWLFQPFRVFFNTQTNLVDTTALLASGTLSDDTLQTIRVYFSNGDGSLWTDRKVYTNRTMGQAPPTVGVATFDGTDAFGRPYSTIIGANGWADQLTSKPIDLNFPASDSIYLSFWYQPEGLGYAPDTQDSLRVEFYDADKMTWKSVWSVPGTGIHRFKPVTLPITEARYLKKGFRFRFSNYANLNGNVDHWSIDYVRLDRQRQRHDTTIQDAGFVYVRPTMLRRYQQVPYTQFRQTMVENKWESLITNRDTAAMRMAYRFTMKDENGVVVNRYPLDYTPLPTDTSDVLPFYTNGYANYARFRFPDFNYNFQTSGLLPFTDSATYTITHELEHFQPDAYRPNDTLSFKQTFHNFWAYDDGTAEKAVWLGAPGRFAMKFTNEVPDTLFGVSMYFSPVRENNESRNIFLQVYQSLDPSENLLYEEQVRIGPLDGDTSVFRVEENNGFTTFILEEPVPLPAGDFYVGWRQTQTFKANVGFDVNSNATDYTFFRTGPSWFAMEEFGAAMIRPLVANRFSVQDLSVENPIAPTSVLLYPNPASDHVWIQSPVVVEEVSLLDLAGRVVRTYAQPNVLSIQGIPSGWYVAAITLQGNGGQVFQKLCVKP